MLFTEPASEKNNPKLILIILPINSQYLERGKYMDSSMSVTTEIRRIF